MNEDNVIDMIRGITEEGDLNNLLKSTIGGYSKKSVMDYLAAVKKQQQNMKETYSAELTRLQAEKDAIQVRLDHTLAREETAEGEFQDRMDAELATLREHYEGKLTKVMGERDALRKENESQALQLDEQKAALLAKNKELENNINLLAQSKQAIETLRIQLSSANRQIEELRVEIASGAEENESLKGTAENLRNALAEDSAAELRDQISELMGTVEALQSEVAVREQELDNRAKRLETMQRESETLYAAREALQNQVQKLSEQNEWLTGENGDLGQRLKEQMEKSLADGRDVAHLKAANSILQRKLDSEIEKRKMAELGVFGSRE